MHDGLAVEDAAPAPGGDAAIVHEAGRVWREVVDPDVCIEMPRAVRQEEPGEFGCSARGRQPDVQVEPRQRSVELGIVHQEPGARSQRRLDPFDQERAGARGLQPVKMQFRFTGHAPPRRMN